MIETCVKQCKTCQVNQNMPASAPIHHWERTTKPWVRIHIDFAGPYLGKMFLVLTDAYSKWMDIYSMSNIKTVALIDNLHISFATYGLPYIIVSDNGPSFTSKEFKTFIHKNGIKHITTAHYHSSSNGAAERVVQTFQSAMRKIVAENSNVPIKMLISRFLFSYCNTPHTQTGKSPSELLFNRKVNTRLSLLKFNRSIVNDKEKFAKSEVLKPLRIFYPGNQVWLRNYRRGDKWIKGTIISKVGTVMYKVNCCNEIYEKHIDQLHFCPDIETELDVTSHSEQNLSLHPIPHIVESNQSNQTTTSPSSDKTLSDNPTTMSSSQSPDNPVPIGPNIDTSPQQSDISQGTTRDRPKRNCRPPAYLKDYIT